MTLLLGWLYFLVKGWFKAALVAFVVMAVSWVVAQWFGIVAVWLITASERERIVCGLEGVVVKKSNSSRAKRIYRKSCYVFILLICYWMLFNVWQRQVGEEERNHKTKSYRDY